MGDLKHFCGIAGIRSLHEIDVPERLFYLLFSLQHRGQESCGIAYAKGDRLATYKDVGMVPDVLSRYLAEAMGGHLDYQRVDGISRFTLTLLSSEPEITGKEEPVT